MSFLSRVLVIIGLSFVMTLILMAIHWEPEPVVADQPVEQTEPAPTAAVPEPTFERATVLIKTSEAHVGLPTEAPKERRADGIDWVMQDAQDIEELPAGVRAALAGCMVPRSPGVPNVISGEFKQAGETDLAVLCVRGPLAAVYVFSGNAPGGSEAGLPVASVDFTPGTTIRTAPAADIGVDVRRELAIEPGMPTRIRHDGIRLGGGCCLTTYYWHRGRWRAYGSID